ncbi:MAG: ribonuclease D [Hyphomicrobiaceae bacterium]
MEVITESKKLKQACDALSRNDHITVDTEFVRETTFWPVLCLIQMAGDGIEVIVDPLADGIDLAPFFKLMGDEAVVKVFHAARQDVEIIYHLASIIPHPIFDTQVAAMVCGFGESVSYSKLVARLLKEEIDKTSQFTDWRHRPLSKRQLTYALADVTHLRPIYEHLANELERSGRSHWLAEEMSVLTAPATYESHPENAWRRLKLRVKSRKSLAIMMELAAWRETEAQNRNLPRSRVIKDDAIYDIANQAPADKRQLVKLRTIHEGFARSERANAVLAAVERGLARDPKSVPPLKRGTPPTPRTTAIVELLRVHLKATAAHHGVATKMIATADELERIALEDSADVQALKGWRRELFGESALALKRGELALAMVDGGVQAVSLKGSKQEA